MVIYADLLLMPLLSIKSQRHLFLMLLIRTLSDNGYNDRSGEVSPVCIL